MGVALVIAFVVLGVGWLGFQVPARPFAAFPQESVAPSETEPLPEGLPAPAAEYFRAAYGERLPVVRSVVITGRGRIRPFGLWMPARFRFTHEAGRSYRHYIEATWFGLPLMRVNEHYLDGDGVMRLPWAASEGPKIDQAMNVSMWAELSSSAPSLLVTDSRTTWAAVDEETALLAVPSPGGGTDTFVVRFDPSRPRIEMMQVMRYKAADSERKVLWTAGAVGEKTTGAASSPAVGSAQWADDSGPWAYFEAEDIRYDVDVSDYIKADGI